MDKYVIRTPRESQPLVEATRRPQYKQLTIHAMKKVTSVDKVRNWSQELVHPDCTIQQQLGILTTLESIHVFKEVLQKTGVGLSVNAVRKKRKKAETDVEVQVHAKACSLLKRWKTDVQKEQEKEVQLALKAPFFPLNNKIRKQTCKALYLRLALASAADALRHSDGGPVERDVSAIEMVKQIEDKLFALHGMTVGLAYSAHARALLGDLAHDQTIRNQLRKGQISVDAFIATHAK